MNELFLSAGWVLLLLQYWQTQPTAARFLPVPEGENIEHFLTDDKCS